MGHPVCSNLLIKSHTFFLEETMLYGILQMDLNIAIFLLSTLRLQLYIHIFGHSQNLQVSSVVCHPVAFMCSSVVVV